MEMKLAPDKKAGVGTAPITKNIVQTYLDNIFGEGICSVKERRPDSFEVSFSALNNGKKVDITLIYHSKESKWDEDAMNGYARLDVTCTTGKIYLNQEGIS